MKPIKQMKQGGLNRSYPLRWIYFYLTEGCNLRCRHCWIAPGYQSEGRTYPSLGLDLFRSIIDQAKPLGLSGVKLTGGEPLLHPQISGVLEVIRAHNLRLTVETNGILCTPGLAQEIAACKDVSVSVSLDGADRQTHEWVRGVPGSFEAALGGIRSLVEAGLKPQVIMTLMRRNRDQMGPLVRLAESLGVGSVKFNPLQPTTKGEKMHEEGEALTIEELVNLGKWVENTLFASTNLRLHYSHPMAFRPLSRIFGGNADGCTTCGILNILGVLGNGAYALCGIGDAVSKLVFGDAAVDRLKDVWSDTPILQELRQGLPHRFRGICGECLMKSRCLGSCVAQNYYRIKNLWGPYWYCEEAHEKGLFPESRIVPKSWQDPRLNAFSGVSQMAVHD